MVIPLLANQDLTPMLCGIKTMKQHPGREMMGKVKMYFVYIV